MSHLGNLLAAATIAKAGESSIVRDLLPKMQRNKLLTLNSAEPNSGV